MDEDGVCDPSVLDTRRRWRVAAGRNRWKMLDPQSSAESAEAYVRAHLLKAVQALTAKATGAPLPPFDEEPLKTLRNVDRKKPQKTDTPDEASAPTPAEVS